MFILGLGSSDEINHAYTAGNPNSGILETSSGGTFKYKLGAWSDLSLLDWNDLMAFVGWPYVSPVTRFGLTRINYVES